MKSFKLLVRLIKTKLIKPLKHKSWLCQIFLVIRLVKLLLILMFSILIVLLMMQGKLFISPIIISLKVNVSQAGSSPTSSSNSSANPMASLGALQSLAASAGAGLNIGSLAGKSSYLHRLKYRLI